MPNPLFVYDWPDPTFADVGAGQQALAGRVWNVQTAGNPWSIQRASNRPMHRFEVRPGDYAEGQLDRNRSELQCTTKDVAGVDLWVSYGLKVSSVAGILSDSMVLGQWHQTEDAGDYSGYPPFELNLHADGLHVYTASVSEANRPTSYPITHRAGPIPFALDEVHQIVIRTKFGWANNAELDVWVDGSVAYSGAAINMGMNDSVGPYWKMGIYYTPANVIPTVSAEYWNFEIGIASLAHRVTAPLRVW